MNTEHTDIRDYIDGDLDHLPIESINRLLAAVVDHTKIPLSRLVAPKGTPGARTHYVSMSRQLAYLVLSGHEPHGRACLSHEDIATVMNRDRSTVSSGLSRVYKALRDGHGAYELMLTRVLEQYDAGENRAAFERIRDNYDVQVYRQRLPGRITQ